MNISLISFDESKKKKSIIGQQTLFVKSIFKRHHGEKKRHHGEEQIQNIYKIKRVSWNI